jgi:hypothetical protein
MSETESPVDTVVRLLSKSIHVAKDDGAVASIHVSKEWCDRELFKDYAGQITVGLAECRDTKVEMSGRIRRGIGNLRVNVWAVDRVTRGSMVAEVNRIVRQNRNKPNETLYDFAGISSMSDVHKAYEAKASAELEPKHISWTELSDSEYEKVWYSDDQRHSKQSIANGEFALMLFRFKLDSREEAVKRIVLAFEGYGTAPAGNGVTVKVWNHVAQAWQNAQSGSGDADETIILSLSSGLTDYVDDDSCVWLLARTVYASNGVSPAVLYCDYVNCVVTVNGITYLDVVSFRDVDRVDVKPFIFRTEFSLKSWSFEDVGV